jgi:hypothetical protein
VVGVATGVTVAATVSPFGLLIPAALLLAISIQHVRSRFETPRRRWRSVAAAIGIDSALLLAYFTGRVAGLIWLVRKRAGGAAETASVAGSFGEDRRTLR